MATLFFILLILTPVSGSQIGILPDSDQASDQNTNFSGSTNAISNPVNSNETSSQAVSTPSQPTIQESEGPPIGLVSHGSINSLINTPATRWIATGNWSMDVANGKVKFFGANMTWYNSTGTAAHTHEFLNLKSDEGKVISLQQPGNNIKIQGLMDVGTNNKISWPSVPTSVEINGKKTITISVDDTSTSHHFASQPILGVVNSLVLCSDTPGPNMEVLPPCTADSTISETSNTNLTSFGNQSISNSSYATYENATTGIRISHPSDWMLTQEGRIVNPSLEIAAKFLPSVDPKTQFTIGIRKLPSEGGQLTVEDYATNILNGYKENIDNFQTINLDTNSTLSNNPGYWIEGTFTDKNFTNHHFYEFGTIVGDKAAILQFDTDESKVVSYLPVLGVVIPSFQIISQTLGSLDDATAARAASLVDGKVIDDSSSSNGNGNNGDNDDDDNDGNDDNSNSNHDDNNKNDDDESCNNNNNGNDDESDSNDEDSENNNNNDEGCDDNEGNDNSSKSSDEGCDNNNNGDSSGSEASSEDQGCDDNSGNGGGNSSGSSNEDSLEMTDGSISDGDGDSG